MRNVEDIVTDAEVIRVHAHANFGPMSPREVVNDGVRKYAVGYSGGHTQQCILYEHGLIGKPKGYSANLTKKGKEYARALGDAAQARIADLERQVAAAREIERNVQAAREHEHNRAEKALADFKSAAEDAAMWFNAFARTAALCLKQADQIADEKALADRVWSAWGNWRADDEFLDEDEKTACAAYRKARGM